MTGSTKYEAMRTGTELTGTGTQTVKEISTATVMETGRQRLALGAAIGAVAGMAYTEIGTEAEIGPSTRTVMRTKTKMAGMVTRTWTEAMTETTKTVKITITETATNPKIMMTTESGQV